MEFLEVSLDANIIRHESTVKEYTCTLEMTGHSKKSFHESEGKTALKNEDDFAEK